MKKDNKGEQSSKNCYKKGRNNDNKDIHQAGQYCLLEEEC